MGGGMAEHAATGTYGPGGAEAENEAGAGVFETRRLDMADAALMAVAVAAMEGGGRSSAPPNACVDELVIEVDTAGGDEAEGTNATGAAAVD